MMVEVREAKTRGEIAAVHALLVMFAREGARVEPDWDDVTRQLFEVISQPETYTLLIAVEGEECVGTLCLVRHQYWYARSRSFLGDLWLYTLPQHRGGDVLPALFREAANIAEAQQMQCLIHINNPSRRRGGRTEIERAASLIGYVPSGAVLALSKEPASVFREQSEDRNED